MGIFRVIIERFQTIILTVIVGEPSSVRMYPQMMKSVFVDMESRTRTIGAGRFYRQMFLLEFPVHCVKTNYTPGSILFKPDILIPIYIYGVNGSVTQVSRPIRSHISGRRTVKHKTIIPHDKRQCSAVHLLNAYQTAFARQLNQ